MPDHALLPPLDRLVRAINEHDLNSLVDCFAEDYVNHTPAHPARGFVGNEQVRRNWAHIFAAVPDVRARIVRLAPDADSVWSEWELVGMRGDATQFLMRGVVILEVGPRSRISAARFYLEPVEHLSDSADEAVRRVAGGPSHRQEQS